MPGSVSPFVKLVFIFPHRKYKLVLLYKSFVDLFRDAMFSRRGALRVGKSEYYPDLLRPTSVKSIDKRKYIIILQKK